MSILDIEHGTLTPLIFTTTGGMGQECLRYHSLISLRGSRLTRRVLVMQAILTLKYRQ